MYYVWLQGVNVDKYEISCLTYSYPNQLFYPTRVVNKNVSDLTPRRKLRQIYNYKIVYPIISAYKELSCEELFKAKIKTND